MFEQTNRVNKETRQGHVSKFIGETNKMIEQRILAQLPEMGKGWKLDIHHAGSIVSWQATREDK